MSSSKGKSRIKRISIILGCLGLVPLLIGVAASVNGYDGLNDAGKRLVIFYSAFIISFLGGINWGFCLARPAESNSWMLLRGIVPIIIGTIVIFLRYGDGAFLMSAGLILIWIDHWFLARQFNLGKWFMALRTGLTAVVIIAIFLAVGIHDTFLS